MGNLPNGKAAASAVIHFVSNYSRTFPTTLQYIIMAIQNYYSAIKFTAERSPTLDKPTPFIK